MIVCFETLGCKLNQSESEALMAAFGSRGFEVHSFSSFVKKASKEEKTADLVLFNTCTVTSMAEQKARRLIKKASTVFPLAVIVVTGCYAQMDPEEIKNLGNRILVADMAGKSRLMDLPLFLQGSYYSGFSLYRQVENFLASSSLTREAESDRFRFQSDDEAFFHSLSIASDSQSFHSRAFVKIQDGCNHRCSYCRIPLARGNSISLPEAEVLRRIGKVLEWGFKEVVLTGINISDWKSASGNSLNGGGKTFPDLLCSIADLASSAGARVRLSSLEPHFLNEALLEVLQHKAIVPHLHLALQSMSETVLKRMNRPASTEKIIRWIEFYRKQMDHPFLAADLITGFDGETHEEFLQTFSVMESLSFAHLHVFPFSPREGTVAFPPKSPVAQRIRDQRAALFRELSNKGFLSYIAEEEGKNRFLLVEGFSSISKDSRESVQTTEKNPFSLWGVTENYLRPEIIIGKSNLKYYKRRELIPIVLHQENQKLIGKILQKH